MRIGAPQRGHGHERVEVTDGAVTGGGGATARTAATRREIGGATARREQPEVADADEAFREDVQEEAPEEFVDVERQRAHLAPVPIVLPPKRDRVVGDGDESVIRDGDAVGVPREVVQDVGGAAKGRLRVDHPRLVMERSEPRAKRGLGGQRLQGSWKREPSLTPRPAQAGDEFPAKDLPQHLHRQKEIRPRVDPPRPIGRQAARRDHTVDVRMMLQALSPGVEDHQSTNRRAQAFRIGRDLQQRRRGGLKQEVVDDALIGQREPCQRFRHREDDVDVAHRQELLLPRGHPGVTGGREALRAMPIPTAVVREGRLRALVAAIAVPAECRGSTLGDGPEDAPMVPGHPGAVRLQETIAVLAHDVGHLKGWPRHRRCFSRVRRAVSGAERVSASRGLATAWRCFWERWRYSTVCRISTWPRSS